VPAHLRAAILAAILSLVLAPPAGAKTHHKAHRAHHKTHHRHHRRTHHPAGIGSGAASPGHPGGSGGAGPQAAPTAGALAFTGPLGAGPMDLSLPSMVGVANAPGCNAGADPTPTLRQYGATLLRVVISPFNGGSGDNGQALPCVQAAAAAGFRVMISIQWWSIWTRDQTIAYFERQLETYGPYAYAIGVGNEEDLDAVSPEDYSSVWQAVQPLIAAYAPGAIRVAGEISPWGLTWLQQAWQDGLPGAQALAFHPYTTTDSPSPGPFLDAEWAHSVGLPTWATEGLDAPGAWSSDQCLPIPLADFVGVSVAFAWLN
jgi:hypothetical protein